MKTATDPRAVSAAVSHGTLASRIRRCRRSVARSDDARPKGGSSPFAAYNSVIFPTRMSFSRRSAILRSALAAAAAWRQSFARPAAAAAARRSALAAAPPAVATRPRHRGRAVGDARADRDLAARVGGSWAGCGSAVIAATESSHRPTLSEGVITFWFHTSTRTRSSAAAARAAGGPARRPSAGCVRRRRASCSARCVSTAAR